MDIPTYEDIFLPLLKFLKDMKSHHTDNIEEYLVSHFNLGEEERNLKKKSGGRLFRNRIDWARFYLRQAGLIVNTKRSHTKITSEGLELLKQNPKKISRIFLLNKTKLSESQE